MILCFFPVCAFVVTNALLFLQVGIHRILWLKALGMRMIIVVPKNKRAENENMKKKLLSLALTLALCLGLSVPVFADCTSLASVTIPPSVTTIDSEVLDGYPNVTIYGVKGSYACLQNSIISCSTFLLIVSGVPANYADICGVQVKYIDG